MTLLETCRFADCGLHLGELESDSEFSCGDSILVFFAFDSDSDSESESTGRYSYLC